MGIELRNLRPSERVQLLNSTSLDETAGEWQLYRDRKRAGFQIGDHL